MLSERERTSLSAPGISRMSDCDVIYTPAQRGAFALLREMWVEPGTKRDWDALHHLHYKAEGMPTGARWFRLSLRGETVGVVAMTLPRPLLKERHKAFVWIKPGADIQRDNRARYVWINNNVRVIGRIVVDTLYRGVGASYRLQNLAARMSGFELIEIQSAMSKYNQFAQKAGFRFVAPMRSPKYEKGLAFMRATFDSHPADTRALLAEIEALPQAARSMVMARTRKWYYANSALEKTGSARDTGRARVENLPAPELIRQLQQLVLGSPLYGVYRNPDRGRSLPERLPLTAFDAQRPEEPLRWTP